MLPGAVSVTSVWPYRRAVPGLVLLAATLERLKSSMTGNTARRPKLGVKLLGPGYASVLLALVLLGCPHRVQGQASSEPTGYRAAIDDAVREFELANFPESLALFERAHAIYPNARTWRGIGMTEFELRHYARCIEALSSALQSTERPLDGALRSDTEDLLARARSFSGELRLEVHPATATLRIDGLPVRLGPTKLVIVAAGDHVLDVEAAGYLAERRAINVAGGTSQTVEIALATPSAVTAERTEPAQPAPSAPKKRSLARNPWLWTAVGVVAAGAITGVAIASSSGGNTARPYAGSAGAVVPGP
jgi:hypothetical protein